MRRGGVLVNKIILPVIFVVFSVVMIIETYSFPIVSGSDVGSALWPRILLYLLIGLSTLFIILTVKDKKTGNIEDQDEEESQEGLNKEILPKILMGTITLIMFVFLFEFLGYLLSILFAYILLAAIMFGKSFFKNIKGVLFQAGLIMLIVYLIFPLMLNLNLPSGVFF